MICVLAMLYNNFKPTNNCTIEDMIPKLNLIRKDSDYINIDDMSLYIYSNMKTPINKIKIQSGEILFIKIMERNISIYLYDMDSRQDKLILLDKNIHEIKFKYIMNTQEMILTKTDFKILFVKFVQSLRMCITK